MAALLVMVGSAGLAAWALTRPAPPPDTNQRHLLAVFRYDQITQQRSQLGGGRVWQMEQEPSIGGELQTDRILALPADRMPGPPKGEAPVSVMRVELRPFDGAHGDKTNTSGYVANRAEVAGRSPAAGPPPPAARWPDPPGSTRWYGFSIYLEPHWAFAPVERASTDWLVLMQWKGANGGSPPLSLRVEGNRWTLSGHGHTRSLGTATPGRWVRFQIGVRLSPSAGAGWVEGWRDGRHVLPRAHQATMDEIRGQVDPVYLKQGIYRATTWRTTAVAYFGPLWIASTRSALPDSVGG